MNGNERREFGDYQTPLGFAQRICDFLRTAKSVKPRVVVEPTCGIGNFLESSLVFGAELYVGIEINPEYCKICRERISDKRVEILNCNFFDCDLRGIVGEGSDVLVIGNPPWVTNSTLSSLGSPNLPVKNNFKKLKGLDAVTGSSNFDIAEAMILRIVDSLKGTNATMAMICKTSVARNVFRELKRTNVPFSCCELLDFSAQQIFEISASACVLILKLSIFKDKKSPDICNVYSMEDYSLIQMFGYVNERFYSDIQQAQDIDFDGHCCLEWRQGVKHDCSNVMELTQDSGFWVNGQKEQVEIENTMIYPLVKSSMFKAPIIRDFSKFVIVTQKKIKEDTGFIQFTAPLTWRYLNNNAEAFNKRKSSIYKGAPAFSMFGIGEYSYSPYKVGVSGFYKRPLFSLLYAENGKPVMTDDTSYFICFDKYDEAYTAMLLLNSEPVQKFLKGIAFLDAKRPFTKKVLERLDFSKMFRAIKLPVLQETERLLGLPSHISEVMFNEFKSLLEFRKERTLF